MALINCPECESEISDKAKSCPRCGYPMNVENNGSKSLQQSSIQPPELPTNLSIGKQITNWSMDAHMKGDWNESTIQLKNRKSDKVHVIRHLNGIRITSNLYSPIVDVHFKQIIEFKKNFFLGYR